MPREVYEPPRTLSPWRKDRQVVLQQFTQSSQDSRGQPVGTWGNLSTAPTVWASIEPLNVRTAEYAHQFYSQATHRVLIDYRADVTKAMRCLFGSRAFYIGAVVNPHQADTVLDLLCAEGDP